MKVFINLAYKDGPFVRNIAVELEKAELDTSSCFAPILVYH